MTAVVSGVIQKLGSAAIVADHRDVSAITMVFLDIRKYESGVEYRIRWMVKAFCEHDSVICKV